MTFLFKALLRLPTSEWTADQLQQLPAKELTGLCILVGIPHSGTIAEKTDRLVTLTALQRRIDRWGLSQAETVGPGQIQAIAHAYRGRELKAMCQTARIYAPSSKYGRVAALLQWRRQCLQRGKAAYAAAKVLLRHKPIQKTLW